MKDKAGAIKSICEALSASGTSEAAQERGVENDKRISSLSAFVGHP
jgi:hypothetical protein